MLKAELELYNGTKGKVYWQEEFVACTSMCIAGVLGLAPGFCVRATAWR